MRLITSNHIPSDGATNFAHAYQHAGQLERPINIHVTLLWSLAGTYPTHGSLADQCEFARSRTQQVMKGFRDFARYHGIPNFSTWVLENPPAEHYRYRNKQVHAHCGFHVPPVLLDRFKARLTGWVFEGLPVPHHSNTVVIRQHPTQWTVARYQLKGISPSETILSNGEIHPLREALQITTKTEKWDQGLIHGKRLGVSRQLDQAARDRFGFSSPVLSLNGEELSWFWQIIAEAPLFDFLEGNLMYENA